jgi:hypothetical protein
MSFMFSSAGAEQQPDDEPQIYTKRNLPTHRCARNVKRPAIVAGLFT